MKTKRTLFSGLIVAAIFAAFRIFPEIQPVQATSATPQIALLEPAATPAPCLDGLTCYHVRPSDTDGNDEDDLGDDCPEAGTACGIGCENRWGEDALNIEHYLYLPPTLTNTGKLLVFFGGSTGSPRGSENIYPVAARQGYHVIGLTYPAAAANHPCAENNLTDQEKLDCYGDAFREVITGENAGDTPGGVVTAISKHKQDCVVNRLVQVLKWAADKHPNQGWDRYLTSTGEVDWTKVHLAGHSNGSSHASFMGGLYEFREIARVSLFAGPDDGTGGTTEDTWLSATYIQKPEVDTYSRYYGLVHRRNKGVGLTDGEPNDPVPVYQVYKNWNTFGMEGPLNSDRFGFDPTLGVNPDFGAAHMLISKDPAPTIDTVGTTDSEAHNSVIKGVYCTEFNPNPPYECWTYGNTSIGYEAAWRCMLGTGDERIGKTPVAHAGPDLRAECRGNGGATVILDGSRSRDSDCDVLSYGWTGPFGRLTGRNPTVFLPLGLNTIRLVVSDDWSQSEADTLLVNVRDTRPPLLDVTLTPTLLSPANNQMVRIHATVNARDGCTDDPPQVVLTSITSGLPDDNGDNIQDASFGTLDLNFALRAEGAGSGRPRFYTITYTATDTSGNKTQTSATVRVAAAHSK